MEAILLLIVAWTAESYATGQYDKVLYRISTLTSDMYIKKLVNQNDPDKFKKFFECLLLGYVS